MKLSVIILAQTEEERTKLRKAFSREGIASVEVSEVQAASQLLAEGAGQLVVVEVGLGLALAEEFSLKCPGMLFVCSSLTGDDSYLHLAMALGARDYLSFPFSDLLPRLGRVLEIESRKQKDSAPVQGKVVTVFSSKGGVGKTTIATNLAFALAYQTGKRVVLWDLDLQFGDVGVMVDLAGKRTIADLAQEKGEIDSELVASYLVPAPAFPQVRVMLAPERPEEAELVEAALVEKVLSALRGLADIIVIDTAQSFQEQVLTALDNSDRILVLTAPDLLTIKNVKLCLEVMSSLKYEPEAIGLVLNRSASNVGLKTSQLAEVLSYPIWAQVPSDGKVAISAVNEGIPFVLSARRAPISRAISGLAAKLAQELLGISPQRGSWFSELRRLGK